MAPYLVPHSKNLSNQGSLKNHVLKEFFKEPIKVPQTEKRFSIGKGSS